MPWCHWTIVSPLDAMLRNQVAVFGVLQAVEQPFDVGCSPGERLKIVGVDERTAGMSSEESP